MNRPAATSGTLDRDDRRAVEWIMRRAEADDLQALVALEAASFPEPWTAAALRWGLGEPSATLLLICPRLAPHRILAYLFLRSNAVEAEILRVAVAPASRGRGLAIALLDAGLGELRERGIRRCLLEVSADNRAALQLYRRVGFHDVGRRARYYRDGSDALVCARDLAGPDFLNPPGIRCYGHEARDRDAASPPDHAAAGATGARRRGPQPGSRGGVRKTSRACPPGGVERQERKEKRLMISVDETLRQELIESHEEFRSLFERHQECERRLDELRHKSVLSEEDELEEKQIKRQKLFLKDQMEAILRSHRESGVSV